MACLGVSSPALDHRSGVVDCSVYPRGTASRTGGSWHGAGYCMPILRLHGTGLDATERLGMGDGRVGPSRNCHRSGIGPCRGERRKTAMGVFEPKRVRSVNSGDLRCSEILQCPVGSLRSHRVDNPPSTGDPSRIHRDPSKIHRGDTHPRTEDPSRGHPPSNRGARGRTHGTRPWSNLLVEPMGREPMGREPIGTPTPREPIGVKRHQKLTPWRHKN